MPSRRAITAASEVLPQNPQRIQKTQVEPLRKNGKKPLVKNISRKRRIQFGQQIGQDAVADNERQDSIFEPRENSAEYGYDSRNEAEYQLV